jgi:hypothetical protein
VNVFAPREPTLDDLIAYVIDRAIGREAAPTKTKLVKLLYLIDVEQWRAARTLVTNLEWRFYHYGPYAHELEPVLQRLEGHRIHWRELTQAKFEKTILYTRAWRPSEADNWPTGTKIRIDRIVDHWADEPLELLLDFVYFETEPMRSASRGEILDFSKITPPAPRTPVPSVSVNSSVLAELRQVLALRRAHEAEFGQRASRYDEIWEEAMIIEASIDAQTPDVAGARLFLEEDSRASFAKAVDE